MSIRAERKKELHRLTVARSDIRLALEGCELLLRFVEEKGEGSGGKFYTPLLDAVAISYSRPFKHSQPAGPLGPEWHEFEDTRFQELHEILIMLRDKSVAHSDREVRKVTIYPPGFRLTSYDKPLGSIGVAINFVAVPIEDFREIQQLCVDLGRRLQRAVDALLIELYGDREMPTEPFPLEFNDEM